MGKIYLQSLSSMIPPIVLNPMKGEKNFRLNSCTRKQNYADGKPHGKRGIYFC